MVIIKLQGEYASLKREITALSQENKVLYEKLEDCARNHMAVTPYSFKEDDLIDNLKNQLNLSLKVGYLITGSNNNSIKINYSFRKRNLLWNYGEHQ